MDELFENGPWLCDGSSWICLVVGSLFAIIGGIGIVRLPDFYSRMHGAGITDTMGAGLVLVGLMFQGGMTLDEDPSSGADAQAPCMRTAKNGMTL